MLRLHLFSDRESTKNLECVIFTHPRVKSTPSQRTARRKSLVFKLALFGTRYALTRSTASLAAGRCVMRTLLRRTSTGAFFEGPDQWTTDPSKARDFRSIDRALAFIQAWALQDVELAFGF